MRKSFKLIILLCIGLCILVTGRQLSVSIDDVSTSINKLTSAVKSEGYGK